MVVTYRYSFKPRHADFDEYGIAHHSRYFCWFEEARYESFEQFKAFSESIKSMYKMPVTRLECKYYQMVHNVEPMIVQVSLELPLKQAVVHLNYRLMDADGKKLYAKGYTEHAFVTYTGELVHGLPKEIQELMNELYSAAQKEIKE